MSHTNAMTYSRAVSGGRLGTMKRLVALVTVATITTAASIALSGSAQAHTNAGTNGKIAFGRADPAADAALTFTINPDGTGETAAGGAGCEAWSPDSSRLLMCTDNAEGRARPATANPDGSDFTLLDAYPNLNQNLACAFWTPDASRFLCNSDVGQNGLSTVRASDGGGLTDVELTRNGFHDGTFGYSHDGSRILLLRTDSTDHRVLYTMRADGSDLTRLSPDRLSVVDLDYFDSVSADWSPNGSRVTFAANWRTGHGSQNAVFVVNADGTGLRQITPSGVGGRSAQWSPNGQWIAFTSKTRADRKVWVVHPDGTRLREVTFPIGGSVSFTPVWSPDSSQLLFQSNAQRTLGVEADQLEIINVDGTDRHHLTDIVGATAFDWGSAPTN
jgi:TolB protein